MRTGLALPEKLTTIEAGGCSIGTVQYEASSPCDHEGLGANSAVDVGHLEAWLRLRDVRRSEYE